MLKVRAGVPLHFSALDGAVSFDGQPSETVPTLIEGRCGKEQNTTEYRPNMPDKTYSEISNLFPQRPITGGHEFRVTHCNNILYQMLCHERTADSEILQMPAQPEVCK